MSTGGQKNITAANSKT